MTVTHFTPVPNLTGSAWNRVSVCGVATRVGSDVTGSSNLALVSCPVCLTRFVPWAPRAPGVAS
jgi:hypothetical protein